MTITSGGNVGIGVTPSTWGSNSFALQTQGGAVWSFSSAYMDVWQNAYYSGSSIYTTSAAASFYRQTSGSHQWFNAPSGMAGTTITFTQAMTLNASGSLGIGTISSTSNSLQKYLSITDNYNVGIILNDTRDGSAFEIYNAGGDFNINYRTTTKI